VVEKSPDGVKSAAELHAYWTKDPRGLAKWATSPHPWTALYSHLVKFMPPDKAKRTTSAWHFEVLGQHTGSDAYRVEHGGAMRGKRIGPG
jgi:hypothetical protein